MKYVFAALLAVLGLTWSPRAHASLEVYHLYVIWLQGEGEANQKPLDDFIDCLFHHSSFEAYWSGGVLIQEEGSYVVPKPSGSLGDAGQIGPFVTGLINAKKIPPLPSYGKAVYQVMVDPAQTGTVLGNGTGGRNALGTVSGTSVGLILNTTNPSAFWPARTPLGVETQLTEHEVAEVIDGLRGGYECAGDFCCEGWCNNTASCGNLSGLECPGAPASTFTGSSACGDVKGWLIQSLSHQGAKTCNGPVTCDFKLAESCTADSDNLHAPCTSDAQCCSGLSCQKWSFTGQSNDPPSDVCCKAVDQTCTSGTDCCGGMNCTSGKCVCVAKDAWCANDADCCAGLTCQNAACAVAPPASDAGTTPDASANDASPPPSAEAGADGGLDAPPEASGCSCNTSSSPRSAGSSIVLAFVVLGSLRRRRTV